MRRFATASTAGPLSLGESFTNASQFFVCAVLPLVWPIWLLAARPSDKFAVDFHHSYWPAARNVLDGVSPFPSVVDTAHVATSFIYPAPAVLLLTPFGLLPQALADVLFTVLLLAAGFLTLRLLGVSDWRCYGILVIWPPVFSAVQSANITLFLCLGLAVLWRVRHRALAAAALVAVLIAVKMFLWPLVVWLIIRHGPRIAVTSAGFAAIVTLGAWSVIGFAGLREYPQLLSLFEQSHGPNTYSLLALGMRLGLDGASARLFLIVVAAVVLAAALLHRETRRDERRSFAIVIFAAILFSPVVWLHYYALMLVPFAILRPRLGLVWMAPLALWFCSTSLQGPSLYPLLPILLFGSSLALLILPTTRLENLAGRWSLRSVTS